MSKSRFWLFVSAIALLIISLNLGTRVPFIANVIPFITAAAEPIAPSPEAFKFGPEISFQSLRFDNNSGQLIVEYSGPSLQTVPPKNTLFSSRIEILDATTLQSVRSLFDNTIITHDSALSENSERFITVGNAVTLDLRVGNRTVKTFAKGERMQLLTLSPDGQLMAATQYNIETQQWAVKVWNAQTGDLQQTLPTPPDGVDQLAFGPENRLAIAFEDTLQYWRIPSADAAAEQLWSAQIDSNDQLTDQDLQALGLIQALHFNTAGTRLTVSLLGNTYQQLDLSTGQKLHTVAIPEKTRYTAISPDGKWVAYSAKKAASERVSSINIIEVATGELVGAPRETPYPFDVVFSPDSQTLIGLDYKGPIWAYGITSDSARQLTETPISDLRFRGVVLSADGRALMYRNKPEGEAEGEVWVDIETAERLSESEVVLPASATRSQDGQTTIVTVRSPVVNVWDTQPNRQSDTPQRLHSIPIEAEGNPRQVAVSPDGKTFVVTVETLGSDNTPQTLIMGDAETREILHTSTYFGNIDELAFSSDNQTFALTTYGTGIVEVWDAHTGTKRHQLEPERHSSGSYVTFSADGSLLVTSSRSADQLWRVETGELLQTFVPTRQNPLTWRSDAAPASISADNTTIASIGGNSDRDNSGFNIYLWDAQTGRQISAFNKGPQIWFNHLALSADGRTLAADGAGFNVDQRLYLWNLPER